ncbi:uncharacterized protein LOC141902771 isoform X2 [Tubulanus polymorphus]|uniref:uncharacterized protein LOC141902771 isoform X2 n=1 Tax=Tubulanus polymorphus TaxID=672921 RepID=UPI003DA4BD3D
MSTFKQEFRCHNFCLGYFRDDLFYLSQWNLPPIVFLIYRFIVSAYVVGCFVYSIVDYEHSDLAKMHNPMAFLTMWSYLMLALHLLLAFINSSTRVICEKRSCLRRPNDEPNFPSYDEYHNLDTAESSSSAGENEVHILSPHTIPWNFKLDWVLFSVENIFIQEVF